MRIRFHVTALAIVLVVSCGRSTSTEPAGGAGGSGGATAGHGGNAGSGASGGAVPRGGTSSGGAFVQGGTAGAAGSGRGGTGGRGGTAVGGEAGAGRGAGGTEGGNAGEASGNGGSGAVATDCAGEVDLSLSCDTDLVCPNGCGIDCHCRNGSWSCAEPDFDTFVGKPCDAPGSCFYDLGDDGSFGCECSSPGAHGESHWACDQGLGSCTGVDGESCDGYALDFSCWNDTVQANCTCTPISAGGRQWQCEP